MQLEPLVSSLKDLKAALQNLKPNSRSFALMSLTPMDIAVSVTALIEFAEAAD